MEEKYATGCPNVSFCVHSKLSQNVELKNKQTKLFTSFIHYLNNSNDCLKLVKRPQNFHKSHKFYTWTSLSFNDRGRRDVGDHRIQLSALVQDLLKMSHLDCNLQGCQMLEENCGSGLKLSGCLHVFSRVGEVAGGGVSFFIREVPEEPL